MEDIFVDAFFGGNIMVKSIKNLTKFEKCLWLFSVFVVTGAFLLSKETDFVTLAASLIGVTALIFIAKGDVLGQILTVVFSVFYSIISLRFGYYGEMITYLGMSAPIAAFSVITWIRHPYREKQVEIEKLGAFRAIVLSVLTALVTFIFYFILKFFNTSNLGVSTVSVATSFSASSLMFLRSPYYALAYAANDIVLIILWILATIESIAFLPMIFCFLMFFINDIYGFFSWIKMQKIQKK